MRDDKIRIRYNTPGHPREFTVHFPEYDLNRYIPTPVERAMQSHLGDDYAVCNRGSRIEVTSTLFTGDGDEHLPAVTAAAVHAAAHAAGVGGSAPEVEADLHPYEPPAPARATCPQCGTEVLLREFVAHRREAHPVLIA